MIEYTRKDIIMDPNDPRLEGAIGKKVYSSSDVNLVLNRANNNEYEMTLTQVEDVDSEPFTVMNTDGTEYDADFIIIKKEEPKPEYVPFENVTEFLDAYKNLKGCITEEELFLYIRGIWLKGKFSKTYCMVAKIEDMGVFVVNYLDRIPWEELLEDYTFLDGSPCGKEVK